MPTTLQAAARVRRKGAAFDPMTPDAMSPGEDLRFDRPRPSKSRYPISRDAYLKLKAMAGSRPIRRSSRDSRTAYVADAARPPRPSRVANFGQPLAGVPLAEGVGQPVAVPSLITQFAGIGPTGWLPPDCTSAVGPLHVMLSVNSSVAIHQKSDGARVLSKSLASWFSNVSKQAKIFDPKLLFDQFAGRWVLLAVSLGPGIKDSHFLLSISKSSDPTGGWWNYSLDATRDNSTKTGNWADFPGLGVNADALYVTANMFAFDGQFVYAKIRIIGKKSPYSGGAIPFKDLVRIKHPNGRIAFTVQPCHTFGAPDAQYLVGSHYPSGSSVTLWELHRPLTTPVLTARAIKVSPYGLPPDAAQKGGKSPLDSGDVRVLNAVFRGGTVWSSITTAHSFGGATNVAAIHWFQIRPSSASATQQGVYGRIGLHYFYPAIMPDGNGNMFMVFSRCGASEYVSARCTGRRGSDSPGILQGSVLLKAGVANYQGPDGSGRNRWGDYAGIGGDPSDSLRVWVYSMAADTGNRWATHVGSLKF